MSEQLELFPEYKKDLTTNKEKYLSHPEWCFQFFDTDPIPFAFSKNEGTKDPLILEIKPIENDGITFQFKGMKFRIFAREISEQSKNELKSESKD